MARVTTYTCDRCGEPLRSDRAHFQVETGQLRRLTREQIDLCEPCSDDFATWINTPPPGKSGNPAEAS